MYVSVVGLLEARREVVEAERRVERGEVHQHVVEAREVADRRRDADVRVERVEVGRAGDRVAPARHRRPGLAVDSAPGVVSPAPGVLVRRSSSPPPQPTSQTAPAPRRRRPSLCSTRRRDTRCVVYLSQ